MEDWIHDHEGLLWWLTALSAFMFLGSLILVPLFVIRIPAEYFVQDPPQETRWLGEHPLLRALALILKNVLGAVFVIAGFTMLVLPGQGLITIVIGISLLNFPGKRRMELWLLRRPAVLRSINWMRRKAHHPPIQLPREGSAR